MVGVGPEVRPTAAPRGVRHSLHVRRAGTLGHENELFPGFPDSASSLSLTHQATASKVTHESTSYKAGRVKKLRSI
jgi:hypothetical protein